MYLYTSINTAPITVQAVTLATSTVVDTVVPNAVRIAAPNSETIVPCSESVHKDVLQVRTSLTCHTPMPVPRHLVEKREPCSSTLDIS